MDVSVERQIIHGLVEPIMQLTVFDVANGSVIWQIEDTAGGDRITSPVSHGTTPLGTIQKKTGKPMLPYILGKLSLNNRILSKKTGR